MLNLFNLKVENTRGQIFTLTNKEQDYQVTNIDGLNPPNAVINSNAVAGMDGSRFASSRLGERNIVLTIKINGDVEKNRLYLYQYFRTKQYCKIYFENGSRNVYAEGYVETIECPQFENGETMQISIICHDPFLKSVEEIIYDISQVIAAFEFPFAFGANGVVEETTTDDAIEFSTIEKNQYVNVINTGDDVSGFIIEALALGNVTNPAFYCVDTNEKMELNCSLVAGDILIINTNKGSKSIHVNHNGVDSNYLRYLQKDSSWLKLQLGDNQFTFDADTGADLLQVVFRYRTRYEGV